MLLCLVALAMLYPMIEALDHRDMATPAADSEIQIIAILTFLGMLFIFGKVLARLAALLTKALLAFLRSAMSVQGQSEHYASVGPIVAASPPLPLRI